MLIKWIAKKTADNYYKKDAVIIKLNNFGMTFSTTDFVPWL